MPRASLVLKRGTVIDGTGSPRILADVAVSGNHIAAIGRSLDGEQEIGCAGLIVAPGFIDTHSHSDLRVLAEPQLPMKVRQGITLEVFGQDGISVAPISAADRPQVARQLAGLLDELGREWDWESVEEYLTAVERAHPALDCAYLVPHGVVRLQATGKMQDSIGQAMRQGGVAQAFKLAGYGRIAVDSRANLVVFDEERVADQATFDEPKQYPRGIEYVIVEGAPAIQKEAQREHGSGIGVRS